MGCMSFWVGHSSITSCILHNARAYLQAVATNGRDDLIQFIKKHAWVYIGTGMLYHEKGYRN